jgi:hypothetical protein
VQSLQGGVYPDSFREISAKMGPHITPVMTQRGYMPPLKEQHPPGM